MSYPASSRRRSRGGRTSSRSTPSTPSTPLPQGETARNGPSGRSLDDKYQLAVANLPRQVDFTTIRLAFEKVLRPRTGRWEDFPIHFTLQVDPPDPKRPKDKNRGTGVIYLNDGKFAKHLATRVNEDPIKIGDYEVLFQKQDGSLARAIQGFYRRPMISREALERKKKNQEALGHEVRVLAVQFGIEGRSRESFSVEWEGDYNPNVPTRAGQQQKEYKSYAYLKFNEGREGENPRSLQIEIAGHSQSDMYRITIPMERIRGLENGWVDGYPFIIMRLYNPPSFETKPQYASLTGDPKRDFRHSWRRLGSLDAAHLRVVAFASKVLRLVITSDSTHLDNFIKMSRFVRLPPLQTSRHAQIARGDLFSRRRLDEVKAMSSKFPWTVAFQCDALLRNCLLLPWEILELKGEINRLISIGERFAEEVLKLFVVLAPNLFENKETALDCLRRAETECNNRGMSLALTTPKFGLFRSRHVLVTPTSYQLEGPYSEQSNRVIRDFGPDFEDHFIRIAFGDEGGALYRHDWEVHNEKFLEERVGTILHNGIEIAGRRFEFLAYSGSGLRQHSFWFVCPFDHPTLGEVSAGSIRMGLGDFRRVIREPARYGARISQAFSATDPSVEMKLKEIEVMDDVEAETQIKYGEGEELKPRKLTWTDGHGTISPDLAEEIWQVLCNLRPGRVKTKSDDEEVVKPKAYQIRLGGYKGVVSVDYKLKGKRLIRVRPSMDKFDAPHSLGIEISEAFNKPSRMYLNRPLIMLLDTLGVTHAAFIRLQDAALEDAKDALNHPDSSAMLMEQHGLGEAFELPGLLTRFRKYGLQNLHERDPFFRKLLSFSLYHAQRELKYHARILVPGSWTVVGVADIHNQLEDGEIYACIHRQGEEREYIEGPVLICRSPTVHPGDVQLVHAIGKPETGSPYDIEKLENTVVFSVKGRRPLPDCLGGGDLDGDEYYLITNKELHPPRYEAPASYIGPERTKLDRDATVEDIIDFVIQYMTHDNLGLIGVNHLRLADQRPEGVLDNDCLAYADRYSDAVDYPKTGVPVSIDGMPKPTDIPDWYCAESYDPNNGDYYESNRALGELFRGVRLSDPNPAPVELPVNQEDVVRAALQEKVYRILNDCEAEPLEDHPFRQLFARYSYELKYQCATHSLAQSANSRLNEEEVVLGTILGKTSAVNESRKRRNLMERLTKQSKDLARSIKKEILGDRSVLSLGNQLARAWTCLEVAWEIARANKFGKNSFGLIALTSLLDVLYEIDSKRAEQGEESTR
ncbi:hypothetical protein FRB90_011273 [Tulasnella sp. 427]|nr:hypothetical protein FRB90_011273 [Tulasnella sp. 427]